MAGLTKMMEFKLRITRRSINLIKEFKNYTYLQNKDGKWLNQPIDAYNHGIDAVRYYVLGMLLGKIIKPKKIPENINIW
jgi:phage terminase large subunit